MTNPVQRTQRLGQSIWCDGIRRGRLTSGELERLVALGITGVTFDASLLAKVIAGSADYDQVLLKLAEAGKTAGEAFEALAVEDVRATAALLRPEFDRSGGHEGYVSLEVDPHLSHDTDAMVSEARRLVALLDRPNLMVKVPATPEGVAAIRRLIGKGINVNATLIFSLAAYQRVQEAYLAGLEDLERQGGDLSRVASVASFFVSRLDTAVDALLEERIRQGPIPAEAPTEAAGSLERLLGKAAVANARLAYQRFKEMFKAGSPGSAGGKFASLTTRGARVQRPLWAGTGATNPAYSDLLYVESLIGSDTVNAVPLATLTAFLEHGRARATLEQRVEEAEQVMRELAAFGINIEVVAARLLNAGVRSVVASYDKALASIKAKQAQLRAGKRSGLELAYRSPQGEGGGPENGPTTAAPSAWDPRRIEAALADLAGRDVVSRIWRKDHTVWRADPTEISNRLGWLNTTEQMCELVPTLEAFAAEVRSAGFRHVVLLGMGGSSLGSEVLRQVLGPASPGSGHPSPVRPRVARGPAAQPYPALIVLDSTVPASVRAVSSQIDPARTLFLVSSKSGGTTETTSFYRHFRGLAERAVGAELAGRSFVAITDRGTPLEKLALEEGFRCTFLNSPEIGGRYSVLSYFGLVPAALAGIDVGTLLERAAGMREACASCVPVRENPGAVLGATIAAMAQQGRDKLTLVTPASLDSLGLWVEQMLAESLGKDGKGIIPVAGEPLLAPACYGRDRLFVYLGLAGSAMADTGLMLDGVADAGHPVVRLELNDRYDLGAEFFRWEFATAVAGSFLGVHPFDQPDVQGSKDNTDRVLSGFRRDGRLPPMAETGSLSRLLSETRPGDYLAVMAYVQQTPEVDGLLTELRRRVGQSHHIAATAGYGPRFLHSTGQLHKGGPPTGLYLQLTADYLKGPPIPGQEYDFGVLAAAQAVGDFGALRSLGRRVVRVHLGHDPAVGLRRLLEDL